VFGSFASKSIRRGGAIVVACLLPAASFAATSTVDVRVESKSFLSGSRTLQLEDGVTQTVTLERPAAAKFDGRCSIFGLLGPDGGVPTIVKIDVTAKRIDDKNVVAKANIQASKVGHVRETLVSTNGDRAECPTISRVSTESTGILRAGEPAKLFDAQDMRNGTDIEVVLTVK